MNLTNASTFPPLAGDEAQSPLLDDLTMLPNRILFLDRLHHALRQTRRYGDVLPRTVGATPGPFTRWR